MLIPGFSCQLSVAGFDPGASDGVFVHLVWRDNRHWLITSALLVIGALAEPHSHNLSLPQGGGLWCPCGLATRVMRGLSVRCQQEDCWFDVDQSCSVMEEMFVGLGLARGLSGRH